MLCCRNICPRQAVLAASQVANAMLDSLCTAVMDMATHGIHLLDAALIHALLPKELHLERLAHVQPRVLDLQQRVVHQVLPPPHLQAQRQQPARSQCGLLGNLRMTW